ncbi:unnamed protein product [Ambrosiozyma monospora]|uniref:Unnamed protein product n=1 Tax=Ambrosiozyma monospora TaxID=43982 RepID=A0ACB5TXE3_AMBMO|nr:unnamed protein product [Ambrosiozyma monospora]
MITPLFINTSKWGCYLFFALINFAYVPFIWFCYPETAGRSLEEIDIIFATAYDQKKLPFRVAQELPKLSLAEVEEHGVKLGLYGEDDQLKPVTVLNEKDESITEV